jgi:periplasmic divalent cation tolerance protein
MSGIQLLYSTVSSVKDAENIADKLVVDRLAACVSFVPRITSVYRWEGRLERESETLLIIKTASDKVDQTISRLKELHPYEVPEIIVLPIERAFDPYVEWVVAETR